MDEARLRRITTGLGSFFRVVHIMKGRSEEAGMKPIPMEPHYLALWTLCEKARTMSELSRRLQRSKPNMTAIVDGLIDEGLARRMPAESDRRIIRICITPKGKRVMARRRKAAMDIIRANLSALSDDDIDGLCGSIEDINRIIAKISD